MDRVLKTALFIGALLLATQVGTVIGKLEKGGNASGIDVAVAAPAVPAAPGGGSTGARAG